MQINDERTAFEAWAHGQSYTLVRDDQGTNPYANCLTVCAWEAWQARATQPRFPMTYCSQCGCELGAGNEGVSSCKDHK